MTKTKPLIITDKDLQKHHFNQSEYDVYCDEGTYILVEKNTYPKATFEIDTTTEPVIGVVDTKVNK